MEYQTLKIQPFENFDIPPAVTLARKIWLQKYHNLLSNAQIHYMLAQGYCPIIILVQLTNTNIWWKKLVCDGKIIGFSCAVRTDIPHELKLEKLYIHYDYHRKGYGKMLVNDAINTMRTIGCSTLILTVNKRNHEAINAYQRYGFEIRGDSIVDIGCGFFMNDYLMAITP